MRLSSMADYAVVTMAAACRRCGGGRVSSGELARATGLPVATVQKLVSKLSAAGLLRSARGMGGGLRLARPAEAISLAEIVEAVEGPIALTACADTARHACALDGACAVRPHWGVVHDALRGALAGVSLRELAAAPVAAPAPVPPGASTVARSGAPQLEGGIAA